jgi:PAS domain S-box-containing protein
MLQRTSFPAPSARSEVPKVEIDAESNSAIVVVEDSPIEMDPGAVFYVGVYAALVLVYFITGKLGLRLATIHPSATAVWAPAGLSLAACLFFGSRIGPAIFLGAFLVNFTTAGSALTAVGIGIGNTAEALTGAYLITRFAGGLAVFDSTVDTLKMLVFAAILSTMLAASVGVTTLCLGGYAQWSQYGRIWLTWWLGDAAGDLIVAPLLILWITNHRIDWSREQLLEAVLLLFATVVAGCFMFSGWPSSLDKKVPSEFLGLPVLFWAAFRFGRRGAVTALFILLAIAITGTLEGIGPFSRGEKNDDLLLLQTFAGLTAVMVIAVATEVAQRRRLDEGHAAIAAIVESSNDAIIGGDTNGIITSWNAAANRIFGFSASEAIGQNLGLIVPPEKLAEDAQILARVVQGQAIKTFETVRRRKDGESIDISLTVSPVKNGDGRIIGVSRIARDITEQRRLRNERDRLWRFEQTAREAAEAASRAKDEFLAMLGHELRNPINAIGLALHLLEKAGSADDSVKARQIIARQTDHVSRMVDDLLDVARVTTGKIALFRNPVNLATVMSECLDAIRDTRQIERHMVKSQLEQLWVQGDSDRLAQVVTNLINNSAKYTPSGGTIQLSLTSEGDSAVIRVKDSGIGITADILPHIFDLFARGDLGLERSPGGLGIGLTLVKRLVELHGGTIEAISDGPDKGSTFVVRLPRISPPDCSSLDSDQNVSSNSQPRRILIAEDNNDSREGLRAWLELSGHEIHEAEDGRRAVEMALSLRPDLMIVDIGLPGINGFEVAKQIRSSAISSKTSIIALSGYGQKEYVERAKQAGFDDFIVKPVDPEKLTKLMSSLLSVGSH